MWILVIELVMVGCPAFGKDGFVLPGMKEVFFSEFIILLSFDNVSDIHCLSSGHNWEIYNNQTIK